jgi:hypothetical protein
MITVGISTLGHNLFACRLIGHLSLTDEFTQSVPMIHSLPFQPLDHAPQNCFGWETTAERSAAVYQSRAKNDSKDMRYSS